MMEKGKLLNGRYRLKKMLGEGGMANVYLADDEKLHREVAIKVLRLDLKDQDDTDTNKRLQREANASRQMNHPNIVKVYDIGEADGMSYIVMQYVKGMDLERYIHKNFPIPFPKVIDIMEQILAAVQEAHSHDIIHRDLKPQNVLIDAKGHVKITDFGIAVALHDNTLTQTNTLLGSVHYLSPEQAKGSMATKKSDIYSLGIILFELLTGKVPFEGESAVSIAIKHFQNDIPSVRKFDPRIPQPLENVVLHATAKDPNDRYDSVVDMATDLKTSLDKNRAGEPKFEPESHDLDETKIIPVPAMYTAEDKANGKQKKAKKHFWQYKRFWLYGGVFLLLLILIVGIVLGTEKKNVAIPDLSGMTQTQAKSVLGDNHLVLGDISYQHSDNVQKNRVIRTYPAKGMIVKETSKVGLMLSSGPQKIKITNFVGQNYTIIAKKLRKQGFIVRKNLANSNDFAVGIITKQDVPKGKLVIPQDTIITLTVSSGRAMFKLRDLSNYTQKSVEDYANENSLVLNLTTQYSDTVENGLVISQDPAAGTEVSAGSNLNVVISLGKKNTKPQTVSFSKTITIPFNNVDPNVQTTSDSDTNDSQSSSTSQSSSNSSTSSSSTTSSSSYTGTANGRLYENHVTIFIQDDDHNINDVYRQLVITQNTQTTLNFVTKPNEVAYYKVVRDGQLILSDEAKPNQSE